MSSSIFAAGEQSQQDVIGQLSRVRTALQHKRQQHGFDYDYAPVRIP